MTQADLLGAPTEFVYKGKTFQLRAANQLEQAKFQRWLEQRARDAVERADVSDERRRAMDAGVTDAIAAGEYEWGGELCIRAIRTPAGLAKLVSIVLADQAVTLPMAQEMVESKLKEIAAVMFAKVADDPKALAAALEKLGLPENYFTNNSRTRRLTGRSRKSRR
jgi:hypothetical protein